MMQIDEELAREELKHNVLVYDKGGGTFDGSLFTSYGRSQITGVSDFVPTEWSQRLFRGRPTSSRKTSKSRSPRRRKLGGDGNGDDPPEQGDRSPGERPCPKPCGYQRPGCTQSCFCGPSGHRPWRPEVPHTCGACTLPSASETEEDPNETVPGEGTLLPCQFGSSRGPEWPQPSVSRATGGRQLAQSTLEAETSPDQDTLSETGEETTDVTTPTSVATQKGPQSRDRLPGWSFEEVEVVDGNADSGTDAEAAGRLAAEGAEGAAAVSPLCLDWPYTMVRVRLMDLRAMGRTEADVDIGIPSTAPVSYLKKIFRTWNAEVWNAKDIEFWNAEFRFLCRNDDRIGSLPGPAMPRSLHLWWRLVPTSEPPAIPETDWDDSQHLQMWPPAAAQTSWEVVSKKAVNIRAEKSATAEKLGQKAPGDIVSGVEDEGWVRLVFEDREGFLTILGFKSREPLLEKVEHEEL